MESVAIVRVRLWLPLFDIKLLYEPLARVDTRLVEHSTRSLTSLRTVSRSVYV